MQEFQLQRPRGSERTQLTSLDPESILGVDSASSPEEQAACTLDRLVARGRDLPVL